MFQVGEVELDVLTWRKFLLSFCKYLAVTNLTHRLSDWLKSFIPVSLSMLHLNLPSF